MTLTKLVIIFTMNLLILEASSCPVFLSLSANGKDYQNSNLVINWGASAESSACKNPPEWIGLYDKNPFLFENLPPVFHHYPKGIANGRIETNMKFKKLNLPAPWNDKISGNFTDIVNESPTKCLNFYVMSYSNTNEILSFECLKIQPTWMTEMKQIEKVPFKDLFIPGTHCSGCYQSKFNNQNLLLKKLGFLQNFDVWTQLVFGIRYLQFSIGYFPLKTPGEAEEDELSLVEHFWIMNDDLKIMLLRPVLEDVQSFIESTKEIVVLDFREVNIGFKSHSNPHKILARVLNYYLGDKAVSKKEGEDMNSFELSIWTMKIQRKYILITYNNGITQDTADYTKILWPPWKVDSTANLKNQEYLEFIENIFLLKNESTENDGWILNMVRGMEGSFEPFQNLPSTRDRAEKINQQMLPILWSLGGTLGIKCNVLCVDFFLSTNIIDIAIYTNWYKNVNRNNNLLKFDVPGNDSYNFKEFDTHV